MKIKVIQCYLPKDYKKSNRKISQFFPTGMRETGCIPVIEKRFPKNFIQIRIIPWQGMKYEYCVCLKPIDKEIQIPLKQIHESNCLLKLFRTNEPDEIMADLYVQLKDGKDDDTDCF